MNDRFGVYDLDSFGGNSYQPANSTMMQQAAQPQTYNHNNGPTMDTYDPNRIVNPMNVNMNTYNPAMHTPGARQLGATHQTMMPSGVPAGMQQPLHQQHQQQQQQQSLALSDFDPVPIQNSTLHRMSQSRNQQGLSGSPQNARMSSHQNGMHMNLGVMASQRLPAPSTGAVPLRMPEMFVPPNSQGNQRSREASKPQPEQWLDDLRLSVSGLSLEPMSGTDILERVDTRTQQVMTRYLPCVDFLVQCQQELRKGLAAATSKRLVHHMVRNAMSPRQFYNTYIANLPERFYRKNRRIMAQDDLNAAVKELQTLCANSRGAERQGCEIVKNTFLGGMKDGESWGLRKWLSKHGGALHICNDSEIILNSCQKLDRNLDSTKKLSAKLRPLAKKALTKLKSDVPASYQEHSTAHPYLPFFHRLEAALKGMSNFDPEDDDVICIDDDDEVEVLKAKPPPTRREKKRKASNPTQNASPKRGNSIVADDDSIVEILDLSPKPNGNKTMNDPIQAGDDAEYMQALLNTFNDDGPNDLFGGTNPDFDSISLSGADKKDAVVLAAGLDRLALMFDSDQATLVRPVAVAPKTFWDESVKYASALRLFSDILKSADSAFFLERVEDQDFTVMGNPPYNSIVRHPLCLRDIVASLIEVTDDITSDVSSNSGELPNDSLRSWNMWRGNDLLQAIDLVFLNSLAYEKVALEGTCNDRTTTNRLRKTLWTGINSVLEQAIPANQMEERKRCRPTRRGESSGFVVFKEK